MTKFDYKTLRAGRRGGVDVLGWGTYPAHSVLAGQPSKTFIDNYPDEAAARAAHPDAQGFSSSWVEPQVSLAHLPGENDPVPGGMYPDDLPGGDN